MAPRPHTDSKNPWRCPYCGDVKTIAARPAHLRAKKVCANLHRTAPDWRAAVAFTRLSIAEQEDYWDLGDVGVQMTPPEQQDEQHDGTVPDPPREEPVATEPAGGGEESDDFDGFLAE